MRVEEAWPHQWRRCSALLIAENTSARGASNSRVRTIWRSEGVVTVNVFGISSFLTVFGLKLAQVGVQSVEALFPDRSIALHPVRDVLEPGWLEAARAPLRASALRNQPGFLQHLEVFRDR